MGFVHWNWDFDLISKPENYLDSFIHFITLATTIPPLPCLLMQVETSAWDSWETDYTQPDPLFYFPIFEIMVKVTLHVGEFTKEAIVLVDTGCRLPTIFRTGLTDLLPY